MTIKLSAGIFVVTLAFFLSVGHVSAGKIKYSEEQVSNGGSISGVVHYTGPAKDVRIDLMKEKNGATCSKHPAAKDGIRFDQKILSVNGLLQNSVVFIENIDAGKPWKKTGHSFTEFYFKNCDISPAISVIRKTNTGEISGNLTVTTQDGGVLHNPIGYLVSGSRRKVLFNKPLSAEVLTADATKSLKRFKKKDKHFFLQCGQHNYMEAEARIVSNPYFFITDENGAFRLDQVPAGKYSVTAWHPYAGEHTQQVIVSEGSEATADFTVK